MNPRMRRKKESIEWDERLRIAYIFTMMGIALGGCLLMPLTLMIDKKGPETVSVVVWFGALALYLWKAEEWDEDWEAFGPEPKQQGTVHATAGKAVAGCIGYGLAMAFIVKYGMMR